MRSSATLWYPLVEMEETPPQSRRQATGTMASGDVDVATFAGHGIVYVTKQVGTILYSTYLLSLSSKQTFRARGERSEGRASLG